VTKDEDGGVGLGLGLGLGLGVGVELGAGDGVEVATGVGVGPVVGMGSGVWMLFGTGCWTRCAGEETCGGEVARPGLVLCGALVSWREDSAVVVAPHAAVAIRTTVAAGSVLIIWAPIAGTHDPSVTRLSRVETRGFASPPHGGFALVVASRSIGSAMAGARLSGLRL
jgi:hypothetical protein